MLMVGMTTKQTLLFAHWWVHYIITVLNFSEVQISLPNKSPKWFLFLSHQQIVFFPLETHSLMVPDGYFYILCHLQWHENWNLSVNRLIHDSRGTVALLRQHPEEEFSLLIGFGGGRDDDVTTRRQGAAKNNLSTWGVMSAAADRTECTQVLRWQICILWVGLERQHTHITHVHWKYKLLSHCSQFSTPPWTSSMTQLHFQRLDLFPHCCCQLQAALQAHVYFSAVVEESFSQIKAPIQQCKKSYI